MLHFTVYHKFTTESGTIILIDGDFNLKFAEKKAKMQDASAKYCGIEVKC